MLMTKQIPRRQVMFAWHVDTADGALSLEVAFGRPRDHAAIQSGGGRRGDGSQENQKRSFPSAPHPPPPPPTKKRKNKTKQNEKNQSGAHMLRWEMLPAGERGEERENPSHPSMRCIALRTR